MFSKWVPPRCHSLCRFACVLFTRGGVTEVPQRPGPEGDVNVGLPVSNFSSSSPSVCHQCATTSFWHMPHIHCPWLTRPRLTQSCVSFLYRDIGLTPPTTSLQPPPHCACHHQALQVPTPQPHAGVLLPLLPRPPPAYAISSRWPIPETLPVPPPKSHVTSHTPGSMPHVVLHVSANTGITMRY